MDRLDQLLGVIALGVLDRLRAAVSDESGVSEAEAGALVHIQAWPGGSVGELAGVVGRSQPAAVRLVDRLVERGLVRREPGADRRTAALVLTKAGSRVGEEILAARARTLATLLGDLSDAERRTLERLLNRVAAGLATNRTGAIRVCRLCNRDACSSGAACPLQHTTGSLR
ncbi:MarR family winged helix-turn-helix transcriptional regulator [Pseudonocardia humida]|uniref:MarR family transcriptional regulator n=1 Tax=Pseudonocardia humida TaxID=2800819 RepID=A0ABT0ZW84_9PSEU|nr:MarR family transcriptional regulator [Pseudonocardia humida]MCO1654935.1 MarR family transcriptional regulator [Pseudonocardia humida]